MKIGSTENPHKRPILSRVIETPGVIVAKSRVEQLFQRVMLGRDEAVKVFEELRTEVLGMRMPERFSRIKKPFEKSKQADVMSPSLINLTEDEYKRQALLLNLNSLEGDIIQAVSTGDMAQAINLFETIVMDIEVTKVDYIEKDENFASVNLQGHNINLEKISSVFHPSPHGLFLGENVKVKPGESVIDVGTGSGLFAILAKKLGAGRVCATEITREAVEITKYNSVVNCAEIDVRQGSFFAGFNENFDVLIANLPQKLILQRNNSSGYMESRPLGVWGGNRGNEILLSFLEEARKHMHKNSRLYIQVYSLTDHNGTLREIDKNYSATKLATREFIEDEIIKQNVVGYEDMKKNGIVDYSLRDGHYITYETAYELKLL